MRYVRLRCARYDSGCVRLRCRRKSQSVLGCDVLDDNNRVSCVLGRV